MRWHEFYYHWQWHLQSSPEALWPLITDTNRFNRDTGLPTLEIKGTGDSPLNAPAGKNARRLLRFHRLGIAVDWEEEPFQWARPYHFSVVRRYFSGPVDEMRVHCRLTPENGGTHLTYEVWTRPRNPLGLIAIPMQVGFLSARAFDKAFRHYDRIAAAATPTSTIDLHNRPRLTNFARARIASLKARLLSEGANADNVALLADVIERGDDLALSRMRPYQYADDWGAGRREILELFLLATRVGLLEFQWDLLCPLCRGARYSSTSLGGIKSAVHCDTCNIDFAVNFDQSVELTFRPSPAIRPTERNTYCVAGPQLTPHVIVQQLLQPGEERIVQPTLSGGRYRLRALNLRGGQSLQVTPTGAPELTLHTHDSAAGWAGEEARIAPDPTLYLTNDSADEQLLILERMAWSDQAATAADVTALQRFRDLFANEALRPGEQIAVGNLVILFTDLRDSTRLYNEIGDAPAFGLVMEHFDVLRDAITAEEGAVVKTIGDAVMAVFRRPVNALRAVMYAQEALAAASVGDQSLMLKAGIHYGSCIAVTLNERLDYFGSTVNIAARLETLSTGRDVIISNAISTDPEVLELLSGTHAETHADILHVENFESNLKGFGTERFKLWRVTRPKLWPDTLTTMETSSVQPIRY